MGQNVFVVVVVVVVILSLVHIGDKIDFDFVDRAVDAQSTARVDRIGVTVVT